MSPVRRPLRWRFVLNPCLQTSLCIKDVHAHGTYIYNLTLTLACNPLFLGKECGMDTFQNLWLGHRVLATGCTSLTIR